jgi:prefoldin subunit 5
MEGRLMGIPKQIAELRRQIEELLAWKESVEKVWEKIQEAGNVSD